MGILLKKKRIYCLIRLRLTATCVVSQNGLDGDQNKNSCASIYLYALHSRKLISSIRLGNYHTKLLAHRTTFLLEVLFFRKFVSCW